MNLYYTNNIQETIDRNRERDGENFFYASSVSALYNKITKKYVYKLQDKTAFNADYVCYRLGGRIADTEESFEVFGEPYYVHISAWTDGNKIIYCATLI